MHNDTSDDGAEHHAIGTYRKYGIDFPDWGDGTKVIVDNREAIVPYEQRIETAQRWLGQAGVAASGPAVNVNVLVTRDAGGQLQAHVVSDDQWIWAKMQDGFDQGRVTVPERLLSERTGR